MVRTKLLGGSTVLAALLLATTAPAWAFDPPQRLQSEEDWQEEAPANEAESLPDESEVQSDETQAMPEPDTEEPEATASSDEDVAVDLCAVAAEREATVDGHRGRVREIGNVQQTGGGWEVEGVIETGKGLVGLFRDETLFSCFVRNGRVENVHIEDDLAAR